MGIFPPCLQGWRAVVQQTIPWKRLSKAVWEMEVQRFLKQELIKVNLGVSMTQEKIEQLKAEYDYVIVAVGTHQPKIIPFAGHERVIAALDYLKAAKSDTPMPTGKQVVIIDAVFKWPIMTKEVTEQGLVTDKGELIPAQTVIISIGDVPSLPFLPESVNVMKIAGGSWIKTDEAGRTSDAKILAVGDVERPGLATNALGAAKRTAEYLIAEMEGRAWKPFAKKLIQYEALTIAHYDPAEDKGKTEEQQAARCLSCGSCRDCHLCETMCPTHAISREELAPDQAADGVNYRYVSDDSKCIACGFCADTCPCGIWTMRPF